MGRPGKLSIAAALVSSVIAMPAATLAATGGASVPGSATPVGSSSQLSGSLQTVSAAGIKLSARTAALEYGGLWVTGTVSVSQTGRTVVLERMAPNGASPWTPATQATVAAGGSFTALWHPGQLGQTELRATVLGSGETSPPITVTVYRPSTATLYGPGLYGRHTACGRVLRPGTVGVANRTLPCGTSVSIYYRGRIAVVPVIDRGPYANHASWDLTKATAQALGMSGTATIGTIPVASSQQQ